MDYKRDSCPTVRTDVLEVRPAVEEVNALLAAQEREAVLAAAIEVPVIEMAIGSVAA